MPISATGARATGSEKRADLSTGSARGPRTASPWAHPQAEVALRRMWIEDGASAGEIASALTGLTGQEVTRSAVIGKIRVLGLTGKGNPDRSFAASSRVPGQTPAQPRPSPESDEKYSDPILREPQRAHAPRFQTSDEAEKRDIPFGTFRLADLRQSQCRFACTPDHVRPEDHRFCGRRTFVERGNMHGSWCPEHLPMIWGQGSPSERRAHVVDGKALR